MHVNVPGFGGRTARRPATGGVPHEVVHLHGHGHVHGSDGTEVATSSAVLTGPEKAVLFLLSLDEEVATPIVREMSDAELKKLRAVAATMREVQRGAIDATFREFLDRSTSSVAVPRGGLPYLRRLSAEALGEARAREVFDNRETSPLARLEIAPPEAVGALLSNEPPQIAGAILAQLDDAASAAILGTMTPERQAMVLAHVSRMTEVPATVLEDMAAAIADELPSSDAATLVTVDGVAKAAAILNASPKEASKAVLAELEAKDADAAKEVREAMFTCEDLVRLDPRAMRELLREVPTERLTLSLKDAPDAVRDAVFAGLSKRAAELINDDLQLLGKVRKADVEAARLEVVQAALRLESEGKIDLGLESE